MVASFGVGDRVQITWRDDASDFMVGNITAVTSGSSPSITVNVDSTFGDTGIPWTPWLFSLIAAANPQPPVNTVSSSSALSASSVSGSSAAAATSAPPSYTGVVATDNVPSATGVSVWHVNMVASFAVGDRVMISWTADPTDNMIGVITAVNPAGPSPTITVNVDTVNGQTGVSWTPWSFTLISSPNLPSSSGGSVSNAAAVNHQQSIMIAAVTIISALSGLLLL